MALCLKEGYLLSVAVFRKIFQCYNIAMATPWCIYTRQRPKSALNSASIPDNNLQRWDSFFTLKLEGGDWGTLFRQSFGKVSDGSPKNIILNSEEEAIYPELIWDKGQIHSWTLLEEFFLVHSKLSHVSTKGITPTFLTIFTWFI